tara:strand:+ start:54280 stop:56007 length:1728 start_codon:yes stop_codon:yes gene_type:complete
MIILGIHPGYHEASVCLFDDYQLISAVALERLTRLKIDGGRVPVEAINECLSIANIRKTDVEVIVLGRGIFPWKYFTHFRGTRLIEGHARQIFGKQKNKSMERELIRYKLQESESIFNKKRFLGDFGFSKDVDLYFFNHHLAHALPTLFHTEWESSLLFTADGGGDNIQYSHRVFKDEKLLTLYGDDSEILKPMRVDSLGLAYGFATQSLGFSINRHEGKLTGLAALGKPSAKYEISKHFSINRNGQILSDFEDNASMKNFIYAVSKNLSREDMASSIQAVLEDKIIGSIQLLVKNNNVRNLGLAGGVFGNVRLNQRLVEEAGVEEIFIYPAMSDQGLPSGGVLQFLLNRDGLKKWLKQRWKLDNLYLGKDYGSIIDKTLSKNPKFQTIEGVPHQNAAKLIHNGKIVAIYTKGMEYGPRALGARSILASPKDPKINQTLNDRLSRSEFMPFAPVISEENADKVFDIDKSNRYTSKFMTITCNVKKPWRERIPAVVHVDGTARPQIINRSINPLYYDILKSYYEFSGIPTIINTSFNAHEEPIINSPEECAEALSEGRVDAVVTNNGFYQLQKNSD